MDGVAAEIPQEIRVLFQHDDRHTGAGQQESEHHPGRAAADDAAGCFDDIHVTIPPDGPTVARKFPYVSIFRRRLLFCTGHAT